MKTYSAIIEKILEEVDADIREQMLADSGQTVLTYGIEGDTTPKRYYKMYELLHSPIQDILGWQALRDRKKK